jgi:hypothetical protein
VGIKKHCYVPPWLTIMHHGATTGTNILERVRAQFIVGRPMASPEDVTRITEALYGDYIPERSYRELRKSGRIPIVPDATGKNVIKVDTRVHRDPRGERVRRQVTEASQIQTEGRARAGLRSDAEPLDIHRWHDVPLPELGPVEPVLWGEGDAGLDGLMLAAGGVWLECIAHAVKAYPGLFEAEALKKARVRSKTTVGTLLINIPIRDVPTVVYQLKGERQRRRHCVGLPGTDVRAFLEARLGPLAYFEVEIAPVRVAGKRG